MRDTSVFDILLRFESAHSSLNRYLDNSLGDLHGIGFSDFQVLLCLERTAGNRLRYIDLAVQLGLTVSCMTRTLLPLEKNGLVARKPNSVDARIGYVMLTEAGLNLLQNALETMQMICEELLEDNRKRQLNELTIAFAGISEISLSNTSRKHND